MQGEVVSFLAGYGQGMPELIVRESNGTESSFVLGPFHYLQAQGFTAQAGDRAEINGWACSTCEHAVAVAQVKNLTRNLTLVLRNADGTPVWIGAQGRRRAASPGRRDHRCRQRDGPGLNRRAGCWQRPGDRDDAARRAAPVRW